MSELRQKIVSRGYWEVVIRPATFDRHRIEDITSLFPLIQKKVVRIRGWDFPHIDYKQNPIIDIDWVGQEFEWEHHKSIWRFFQSGQFIYIGSISLDWRDESTFWHAEEDWKPGGLLGIGDTIFTFTEITELASRIALSDAGDHQMSIEVLVSGLKGRMIYVDSHRARWPLDFAHVANIGSFPINRIISREELVATQKELALELAKELFRRFNWDPTIDLLRDWQEKKG